MKLPFKRKKSDSTLPAEIQDYYQSEGRQRVGVAWLLALGTLILTLLLALALFFGGRWIYRAVMDRNDKPQTGQQAGENDSPVEQTPATPDQTPGSTPAPAPSQPAPTLPVTNPSAPATTPNTGPGNLPNTGPSGDE